jgi:hypothetical protein
MQSHGRKRMSENKAHTLRHVTLAGMWLLCVITEVGTLKHSTDDLAQDEDADDCPVGGAARKKAFDIGLVAAGHPLREGLGIGRRKHPAVMERATEPVRRNDLGAVTTCGSAEVDAFTDLEGRFLFRFGHAVPTIPGPR